jgi:hypothetical protein
MYIYIYIPNLSSFLPTLTPGAFISIIKQDIPLCLRDLSVVASTTP